MVSYLQRKYEENVDKIIADPFSYSDFMVRVTKVDGVPFYTVQCMYIRIHRVDIYWTQNAMEALEIAEKVKGLWDSAFAAMVNGTEMTEVYV